MRSFRQQLAAVGAGLLAFSEFEGLTVLRAGGVDAGELVLFHDFVSFQNIKRKSSRFREPFPLC